MSDVSEVMLEELYNVRMSVSTPIVRLLIPTKEKDRKKKKKLNRSSFFLLLRAHRYLHFEFINIFFFPIINYCMHTKIFLIVVYTSFYGQK